MKSLLGGGIWTRRQYVSSSLATEVSDSRATSDMDIQEDASKKAESAGQKHNLERLWSAIGATSLDELIAFQASKFTDLASLAREEEERAMFFAEKAKLLAEESFKLASEEQPFKGK